MAISMSKKNKTGNTFKRTPVVAYTVVSAKDTLFPEKLKKANEILSKTVFLQDNKKG